MKWTGGHGVAERRWNELGDWDYHITLPGVTWIARGTCSIDPRWLGWGGEWEADTSRGNVCVRESIHFIVPRDYTVL